MASSFGLKRALVVIFVVLLLMPAAVGAQGFGVFKKTVMLSRSLPPVIDLSGTKVTIKDFTSTTRIDPQDRSQVVTAGIRAEYRTIDNLTKQSLDAKNVAFDYD